MNPDAWTVGIFVVAFGAPLLLLSPRFRRGLAATWTPWRST